MRAVLALAVTAVAATVAHADPAAEAMFREGRDLMKAGKIAEACDRFARSQELEPRVGTLLNLGDCREQQGRIADAWGVFVEARSLATRQSDARADEAGLRAGALAPKLAWLTINVPAAADRPDGLAITRNGETVASAAWDTAFPVDPGPQELAATAPGRKPWSTRLTLSIGGRGISTVPALAIDPDAPKPELPGAPPFVIEPPLSRLAFGVAFGGTSDRDIVGGLRVVVGYPVPRGAVRATLQGLYTRFHPDDDPYHNVDLYGITAGFDYLFAWGKGLASAAGLGVGLDVIDDNYDDVSTETWASVRLSPLIVRLSAPKLEIGLHGLYVFDSQILVGVLGVDWFVW